MVETYVCGFGLKVSRACDDDCASCSFESWAGRSRKPLFWWSANGKAVAKGPWRFSLPGLLQALSSTSLHAANTVK